MQIPVDAVENFSVYVLHELVEREQFLILPWLEQIEKCLDGPMYKWPKAIPYGWIDRVGGFTEQLKTVNGPSEPHRLSVSKFNPLLMIPYLLLPRHAGEHVPGPLSIAFDNRVYGLDIKRGHVYSLTKAELEGPW